LLNPVGVVSNSACSNARPSRDRATAHVACATSIPRIANMRGLLLKMLFEQAAPDTEPTLSNPSVAFFGQLQIPFDCGRGARAMGLISGTSALALGRMQSLIAPACCWAVNLLNPTMFL
jgi:hypothetical protein